MFAREAACYPKQLMMDSCRLTSVDELVNSAGNAQHIREDHSNVNILQQAEKYINQSFQHEDGLECVESGISHS